MMKRIALSVISATALLGLSACGGEPAEDTTFIESETVEPLPLPEDDAMADDAMAGDAMADDAMAGDAMADDAMADDNAAEDEAPAM